MVTRDSRAYAEACSRTAADRSATTAGATASTGLSPITTAGPVVGMDRAAASEPMSTPPPRAPSNRWICTASLLGALSVRVISRAATAEAPRSTAAESGASG